MEYVITWIRNWLHIPKMETVLPEGTQLIFLLKHSSLYILHRKGCLSILKLNITNLLIRTRKCSLVWKPKSALFFYLLRSCSLTVAVSLQLVAQQLPTCRRLANRSGSGKKSALLGFNSLV